MSIHTVNAKIKEYTYFEFAVKSFVDGRLVIVGSEDLIYFHRLEVHFNDVFSIIGNLEWRVDTTKECLSILRGPIAVELNKNYRIESGNEIFCFLDEDGLSTCIAARAFSVHECLVKYY